MENAFRPLRFTGTAVTVASFAFQVVPAAITYLSPPYDVEHKLFLVFAVYLPAAFVLIVLQARFLSNAIENLRLFKTGITAEPQHAWASAVPFVNFFATPWLVYTVHERTMSLDPARENTADRSGYLTLAFWGTFIGAFVVNALAEAQPTPDARVGNMLFGTAIGMVSSALIKRIVGEIVQTQEMRAGVNPSAVTPKSVKPATAAARSETVRKSPLQNTPLTEAPKVERLPEPKSTPVSAMPAQTGAETKVTDVPANHARIEPEVVEDELTILRCPMCGAGFRAPNYDAHIVICPMCAKAFEVDTAGGTTAMHGCDPSAAEQAASVEAELETGPRQEPPAAPRVETVGKIGPPSRLGRFLSASFAIGAPLATFVLASEWGDVLYSSMGKSSAELSKIYMMRAGLLSLAITLAVAAAYSKLRGANFSAREAVFIWSGCALTFAMATGLLFNKYEWVALGNGPDKFFYGGLPAGFLLSAVSGALLRRRWQRNA